MIKEFKKNKEIVLQRTCNKYVQYNVELLFLYWFHMQSANRSKYDNSHKAITTTPRDN